MVIWDLPSWAEWYCPAWMKATTWLPPTKLWHSTQHMAQPWPAPFLCRAGEFLVLVASSQTFPSSWRCWIAAAGVQRPALDISTHLFFKPTTSSLQAPFSTPLGSCEVGKHLLEILFGSVNSSGPLESHRVSWPCPTTGRPRASGTSSMGECSVWTGLK